MYHQDLSVNNDLEKAWRTFVQGGEIDHNIVRPDIARSWFRCTKQREAADLEPLPDRILRVKREKNRELIEAAKSILDDVAAMLTSSMSRFSVILLDSEGDIIEMINHDTNLLCLGHHCSEMKSGTNAGAIALIDGAGVEVVGYEHLYPYAHKWHTIGVPIRNANHGIAGVFGVLHVDGPCPVLTMQTVSLGAQLIETRLQRDQLFMDVSSLMVERLLEPAVLVNQQGLILDLNEYLAHLLQMDKNMLLGENICSYWSGEFNQNTLLSGSIHLDNPLKVLIKPNSKELKAKAILCNLNKYIIKPDSESGLLLFTISRAENYDQLENLENLEGFPFSNAFSSLIGRHPAFLRVIEDAQRAAGTTSNILIEGKSGTGKELMARAIHRESGRKGTFLAINCGSIPKELLHSELFGYEEGAFTGAKKGGSPGKFELANGGTLFLDEIGEMPLDMQVSLLRFLEDKTVTRMGGYKPKAVDVRIIAATNRNLAEQVQKGKFREDLFYRLNVVYLKMPTLRERKEDIPLLIEHILHRLEIRSKMHKIKLNSDVMSRLCAHDWPGNVRELQNVLESSAILAGSGSVTMSCLPEYLRECNEEVKIKPAGTNLKEVEKALILETLSKHNDNISKTAQELGITRTTLYNKIEQLGIIRSKVAY